MTLNPSRSRVAATAKRPVEVITLSDDDAHPVAPKTPELSTEVQRTQISTVYYGFIGSPYIVTSAGSVVPRQCMGWHAARVHQPEHRDVL